MATVRLVDLLAGLSRLADLGFGLQAGESLRSAALAAALGQSLDLPDEDVRAGLYTAAADAYQAMTQHRPHRAALAPEQAQQRLLDDAASGRLDADAVAAVLAAAGHDAVVRRELPAGLTKREVEVLALLAEGGSNAQIAERLVISRRTAEQHLQSVYRKIGVSSRAAAALFAMEHHLLGGSARKD